MAPSRPGAGGNGHLPARTRPEVREGGLACRASRPRLARATRRCPNRRRARLVRAQAHAGLRRADGGAHIAAVRNADSAGFDDQKMPARSFASGQEATDTAVQCRQTARARPCKAQQVGIGYLTMAIDPNAGRERGRRAIYAIGPELVAAHGGHVLQQGKRLDRRNRVRSERGVGRQPDKSELRHRTGSPVRRALSFEPCVRGIVMDMRRPCQGEQEIEIEQEGQGSASYRLIRSRVKAVPPRETANTGNPLRLRRPARAGRNPRRANWDSTVPTETLRSPAIDLAASRISSSMFSVVLMRARILQSHHDVEMFRCAPVSEQQIVSSRLELSCAGSKAPNSARTSRVTRRSPAVRACAPWRY